MVTSRFCRHMAFAAAALLAVLPAGPAPGQPSRPISIIVPFSPGSGPDIVARVIADPLGRRLGQSVVVENKTGASGGIGIQLVARAAPDGTTLLVTADPPFTTNQFLQRNSLYDPLKQFSPIGELATGKLVLVVHSSVEAQSAQALVSYAKVHPEQLTYGSPGQGTPQHLAMEFFKSATGISIQHIPFKDAAGATTALIGGHVSAAFLPIQVALPLPHDKVRILGVASDARIPSAPEVPTLLEQGIPGFEVYFRIGLLAPTGLPSELVERYSQSAGEIIRSADLADKLAGQGLTAIGSSPNAYASVLAADQAKWRKVINDAKITPLD